MILNWPTSDEPLVVSCHLRRSQLHNRNNETGPKGGEAQNYHCDNSDFSGDFVSGHNLHQCLLIKGCGWEFWRYTCVNFRSYDSCFPWPSVLLLINKLCLRRIQLLLLSSTLTGIYYLTDQVNARQGLCKNSVRHTTVIIHCDTDLLFTTSKSLFSQTHQAQPRLWVIGKNSRLKSKLVQKD